MAAAPISAEAADEEGGDDEEILLDSLIDDNPETVVLLEGVDLLAGDDVVSEVETAENFVSAEGAGTLQGTSGSEVVNDNAVNYAPVAGDDAVSTSEDTPLVISAASLLANDSDVDQDTLSVQSFTQGANGTVVDNGDGTFTYTPNADFNGVDSFTYTVSDGNGGTDTATVTLTVNAVNDAPVAGDDAVSTNEDTPLVISTASLLANDSDADLDTLSITGFTQGTNGTVVDNGDGTFTYTPNADFNGVDSFTYTVSDGQGGTDTGTVTVTVNPVNDAPVAGDDAVSTNEDTPLVISAASLLANDSDVDLDTLSVQSFTQGANGTVVDNGDGTFTYTTNADFNGVDSFTYTVYDGNGGTDTGTVTVTVTASGGVTLNGGAGDDTLIGGPGDDTLNGFGGNDTLVGNGGADALDGGAGIDTADYSGSSVDVTVNLATGTGTGGDAQGDTLINIENLTGSIYDDNLTGDGGANTLSGGAGADTLIGGAGADSLFGGLDNDVMSGGDDDDFLQGNSGADSLFGDAGADTLMGASGNDTLDGGAGDDTLNGGGNDDSVLGGIGDDTLSGNAGNGTLDGGAGVDVLLGGGNDDILVWDLADTTIDGGSGADTLRVESGDVDLTTFGGAISRIEQIDLEADAGANSVTLSMSDVLDISDTDILTILGDAGDSVDAGTGRTDGGIVGGYHVYIQGTATLNLDTDLTVNPDILT